MDKPLLILAFNRPQHIKRLIDSLRPQAPQKILVGVDGPRPNNKNDLEKVSQVLEEIRKIDWTLDIDLRVRANNLGLRFAVADAVTWAIAKYGEVIVVEDDIEIGPEFLNFMSEMLDRFRDDLRVGHISGYNLVPESVLTNPHEKFRLSQIPESYAWATWRRAWELYDPDLKKIPAFWELKTLLGGLFSALIWKINFHDAKYDHINTWAYRWVATLWNSRLFCVSPNSNLVSYTGRDTGTHTRTKLSFDELPVRPLPLLDADGKLDKTTDNWIFKTTFLATPLGTIKRALQSIALSALKIRPTDYKKS